MSGRIKINGLLAFVLLGACVERIEFDIPTAKFQTVIEGMISDKPGPYTVRVSNSLTLDARSAERLPVKNAQITLLDDEGNVEQFTEVAEGVYQTGGEIVGQLGHSYHIRIVTANGKTFESKPDRLNVGGSIDAIKFEFEPRTVIETYGELPADVFNIYVDATAASGEEVYVRWKFRGTYKIKTMPELRKILPQGIIWLKDPPPCSGYYVAGGPMGGILTQNGPCTCCICWVSHFESAPQLSDGQLVEGNWFRNIKVAEVPIDNRTFYEKYLVEVEQMSLSKESFEFFKLIRAQKNGVGSLFQPPSGELTGNITATNPDDLVIGLFWASSVTTQSIFINRSDVPYTLTPIDTIPQACTFFANASTFKPEIWQ